MVAVKQASVQQSPVLGRAPAVTCSAHAWLASLAWQSSLPPPASDSRFTPVQRLPSTVSSAGSDGFAALHEAKHTTDALALLDG